MSEFVLAVLLTTPDGTILNLRHSKDFKSHIDLNGENYYLEGGFEDSIMMSSNINKPTVSVVTNHSDFDIIRDNFHIYKIIDIENQKYDYIPLKMVELDYLISCVNSKVVVKRFLPIFVKEINYRLSKGNGTLTKSNKTIIKV